MILLRSHGGGPWLDLAVGNMQEDSTSMAVVMAVCDTIIPALATGARFYKCGE